MKMMRTATVAFLTLVLAGCCCQSAAPDPCCDTNVGPCDGPNLRSYRFAGIGLKVLDPRVEAIGYRVHSATTPIPSGWRCVAVQLGRAVDLPPRIAVFRKVYHVQFKYFKDGAWHGPYVCTAKCEPGDCVRQACGTIARDGSVTGFNCAAEGCPNPFAQTPRIRCPKPDELAEGVPSDVARD